MADKAVKEAEEIKEETPETEEVLQENEAEAGGTKIRTGYGNGISGDSD